MFGHGGGLRLFPRIFFKPHVLLHESAFLPHEISESESKVSEDSSGHGPTYVQCDSCHGRK